MLCSTTYLWQPLPAPQLPNLICPPKLSTGIHAFWVYVPSLFLLCGPWPVQECLWAPRHLCYIDLYWSISKRETHQTQVCIIAAINGCKNRSVLSKFDLNNQFLLPNVVVEDFYCWDHLQYLPFKSVTDWHWFLNQCKNDLEFSNNLNQKHHLLVCKAKEEPDQMVRLTLKARNLIKHFMA